MTTTDQGAVTVAHKSADYLVRINGDANDFLSFSGDEDDNGLSMTQHRYYRWGVNCVVAIGEMNRRNQWDDQAFDKKCATLEARLASVSSASAETPAGTFACPICGKDTPHYHSPEEVKQHRETEAWVEESWQQARPLFFPEPVPATNQAGEVDVTALQERIADLEGELEEALYQPWPKWAEDMKKQIRDVSGYDGYDDATDGVNLPDELSELINELTEQADKNVAEARAARKLGELESSVEHYRNGMNEWIAKAQALAATQPATSQEGEAIAMARRCQQARHSAVEPVERDNVLHEAATLLRRLAATPTPPTLSEDLREAVEKIAAGTDIVLENGEVWSSPLGARHSQEIARAALARVKA